MNLITYIGKEITMGLLIKATKKIIEAPNRSMDKAFGKTKCPNPLCRSADVIKMGRKWHCRKCGRDFK